MSLTVTGTVHSVVDDSYINKDGNNVPQQMILFLPEEGQKDMTQVSLNRQQCANGAVQQWLGLQSKKARVSVYVVSFRNGGYKLCASGDGMPITNQTTVKQAS